MAKKIDLDSANTILVFGSNLRGAHGKGAAAFAHKAFGARYGCGVGLTGRSYAIPTKDASIQTLPLDIIRRYVQNFIHFANLNPDLDLVVTQVGCGLAGYKANQIAPLFKDAPDNCILPTDWLSHVGRTPPEVVFVASDIRPFAKLIKNFQASDIVQENLPQARSSLFKRK